ncbi:MAG: hypothetical protein M1826_004025 [Phylliscum demangeonii]|nr:MAG: hypothetical protein M1826_004025 [Phylliscum demangeonii]
MAHHATLWPSAKSAEWRSAEWHSKLDSRSYTIHIKDLVMPLKLAGDGWGRAKDPQPVYLSIDLGVHERVAASGNAVAEQDQVDDDRSFDYGAVAKRVVASIEAEAESAGAGTGIWDLYELADTVLRHCFKDGELPEEFMGGVAIFAPHASLYGAGVRFELLRAWEAESVCNGQVLRLEKLVIPTLVGVHPHERTRTQPVIVTVALDPLQMTGGQHRRNGLRPHELEQIVVKTVEESSVQTLEALATRVAENVIKLFVFRQAPESDVQVTIEKASAIAMAATAAVRVVRSSRHDDPLAVALWRQCGRACPGPVPFPLDGSLQEYMQDRLLQVDSADEIMDTDCSSTADGS